MTTTPTQALVGEWHLTSDPPEGWDRWVRELGGGFFHSPLGLDAGAPAGERLYAHLRRGEQILGVALGVRTTCAFSGRSRHVYFPTWPAFGADGDRATRLAALATTLREAGLAEARWDSFDSGGTTPPASVPSRVEFLLDLAGLDAVSTWPTSENHRRNVRRGEREGWELRRLGGNEAVTALSGVMDLVTERISARGGAVQVRLPAMVDRTEVTDSGRAVVWAAIRGDELLAVALLGIGPTRAFYVMGGATSLGYAMGASVWLHARIAVRLSIEGLRYYNLGGTPATAAVAADPSHGLYRFKRGFGSVVMPCAGDRWILRPGHVRGHELLQWAVGRGG